MNKQFSGRQEEYPTDVGHKQHSTESTPTQSNQFSEPSQGTLQGRKEYRLSSMVPNKEFLLNDCQPLPNTLSPTPTRNPATRPCCSPTPTSDPLDSNEEVPLVPSSVKNSNSSPSTPIATSAQVGLLSSSTPIPVQGTNAAKTSSSQRLSEPLERNTGNPGAHW
ncbi:hypothetical protein DFS34DRAFT_365638 [Phlyctochytrium arcticum]|nr:hypothetical protein DFS34DRAFT_365638 [Phlyctochytrium arcticum]